MKIGIFGGTFDPIHLGHLIKAEEAREALQLDEVWFIPAGDPWMKRDRQIAPARHRLAMVTLAISPNPHFKVSNIEITREGPTYTVDTLEALNKIHGPKTELYLLLGADTLQHFSKWRSPERVLELSTIGTFTRPGGILVQNEELQPKWLDSVTPGASATVRTVAGLPIGISGTDIRQRIAEDRSIRYLVPEAVAAYIAEHNLYR